MKAMILAAGLGTRLRPLTDNRPKALIEIHGRTLLEMVIARLRSFGVNVVMINVHHYAEMIIEYLKAKQNFGLRIDISREEILLDTGGGLKRVAYFFLEDSSQAPFILHNVDVISNIDLRRMIAYHIKNHALATLAVQNRMTSRHLLFDEQLQLCGRRSTKEQMLQIPQHSTKVVALAFSGIHVISPAIFSKMIEQGVFSTIETYLRLAAAGEKILGFQAEGYYWRDLGKPENLKQVENDLTNRKVSF
jgi:NDP-sugar pyrophosphorylase family protein